MVRTVLRHLPPRGRGAGRENWNYASVASRGTIARRYPCNYEMGIGQEYPDYGLPGVTTDTISEQNQRGFYQRWAELMEAEVEDVRRRRIV